MSFFERKQSFRENMTLFRKLSGEADKSFWQRLRPGVLSLFAVVVASVILTIVCFWGRPTHLPILAVNTTSRVNVSAAFDFEYQSQEAQTRRVQEALQRIPPVYRVEFDPLSQTATYRQLQQIVADENRFAQLKKLSDLELEICCVPFSEKLPGSPDATILAIIVRESPDGKTCAENLGKAADALERILRRGVFEGEASHEASLEVNFETLADTEKFSESAEKAEVVFDSPFIRSMPLRGVERATALRNLGDAIATFSGVDHSPALRQAIFALFRPGVVPNIKIDVSATELQRRELSERIGTVRIKIKKGDLLVERDKEVTPATVERWDAYREALPRHKETTQTILETLRNNFLPVFAAIFFISVIQRLTPTTGLRKRHLTLAFILVPANLLLIRIFLGLDAQSALLQHTSSFLSDGFFLWFVPSSLAAIFLTLLGGWKLAVFAAFAVSILTALMFGHSLDVFLVAALSNLVAVHLCDRAHSRSDIIKAGVISGIVTAFALMLVSQTNGGVSSTSSLLQVMGSLCGGMISGLFVLGILPLLERLFKLTSNFTYNELVNSREPLLAKLQIVAPGTYNHSTNVATLAESAASAIGANALLCHCAAYYHDIGKMFKPEYFVENQHGENPHDQIPPAISATILKSHVREGAELARINHLPRSIIEIIEQHHGSGLIEYFYNKACMAALAAGQSKDSVDKATYCYQNPKPRTRESAILLFADSLEAATRTLKHYNKKNISQLVDRIVSARVADGQLDECPLTFREVQTIRRSLKETLMHMYHHRVEYPGQHGHGNTAAATASNHNAQNAPQPEKPTEKNSPSPAENSAKISPA